MVSGQEGFFKVKIANIEAFASAIEIWTWPDFDDDLANC